mmetsp:Transcript_42906/g.77957  ORF Transcript_42906/g.77957 Transcript_42906/m.77957 type:complete len:535 (-) Transcript_42906:49-1653(-)
MAAGLGVGWQTNGWAAAAPQQAMWAPQMGGLACMAPQWQVQPMQAMQLCPMPQYAAMQQAAWNPNASNGWAQPQAHEAGLDPAAVSAMAQQLGIDPEDAQFRWMAELALQSPLPQRWSCNRDPASGCIYYTDQESQTSSWENPLIPYLRRVVDIGRDFVQSPTPDFLESEKGALWQEFKDDLDGWHGPFGDPSGRTYYVNHRTNSASSADPRVDSQYIYELQCSFLDTLYEVLDNANRPETPGTPGSHWGSGEGLFSRVGGADVLTLDSSPQSQQRPITPRLVKQLQQNAQVVDHKSTLEIMSDRMRLFVNMRSHDEEAQRIVLSKKAKARSTRVEQAAEAKARMPPSPSGSDALLSPNSLRQKRLLRPLELNEDEGTTAKAPMALPPITTPSGPAPKGLQPKEWSTDGGSVPSFGGTNVPPAGLPSPANRVPPILPSKKGAMLTPLANRPMVERTTSGEASQPPAVPASPSLHKTMGGKDTAAVNFLAKSLAAAAAKGAESQGLAGVAKDFGPLATVNENGESVIDLEATMLT